ncbi:armadillo-type protein [Mycena rebaudengoi]|nr:armadillo-type protein [Mycena rebaudengoi]
MQDTGHILATLPQILQLLKPEESDHNLGTAVLHAISAFTAIADSCADTITAVLPKIASIFRETDDEDYREAAAQVFVAFAKASPATANNFILPLLMPLLNHVNSAVRVAVLNMLSQLGKPGITGNVLDFNSPPVFSLLEDSDDDVCIAAINTAVSLHEQPELLKDDQKFLVAIQRAWKNILADLEKLDPSGGKAILEKLPKLGEYVWALDDTQVFRIVNALRHQCQADSAQLQIHGLRTVSKLLDNDMFRDESRLVNAVPKMKTLLAPKRRGIRVAVVKNLLKLANYEEFRQQIGQEIVEIIAVLRDSDPEVRAAGLKLLSKLAREGRTLNLDRIKANLSLPPLLKLLQNHKTRADAALLITYLASDKTSIIIVSAY